MCEESSKKILPAIRKQLVLELLKQDKTQTEIASILDVTPAAITQYVKGRRAHIDLTKEEKEAIANVASKGVTDERICELCKQMQKRFKEI